MSFSVQWDRVYRDGNQNSIWPWSDLVSYWYRHVKPFAPGTKVLEIGFGAGANIPFFLSIGVDYWGIEGSDSIVARVRSRYPELKDKLTAGDFIRQDYSGKFDVVVDRSSMTHNDSDAIRAGLKNLGAAMNPGAKYIGIDWFSAAHPDSNSGERVDEFTRNNLTQGQFTGLGKVHFSSQEHLIELFSDAGLRIIRLEHKQIVSAIPGTGCSFASWNLVAEKA